MKRISIIRPSRKSWCALLLLVYVYFLVYLKTSFKSTYIDGVWSLPLHKIMQAVYDFVCFDPISTIMSFLFWPVRAGQGRPWI